MIREALGIKNRPPDDFSGVLDILEISRSELDIDRSHREMNVLQLLAQRR